MIEIVAVGLFAFAIGLGIAPTVQRLTGREPKSPLPLTPQDSAAVNEEFSRGGEVAALRVLRKRRPDISLKDARRLLKTG